MTPSNNDPTLQERIDRYRSAVLEALGSAGWEINSDDELDEALTTLHSSGRTTSDPR